MYVIHGGLEISVNAVSMLVLGIFFISGIDFFLLVKLLFVLFLCELSGALLVDQVFIKRSSSQTDEINVFNCDFFLILEELFNEFFLFLKLRNRLWFIVLPVGLDQMVKHLGDFLGNEGNGPLKKIHKVGKQVRMLCLQKLLNVECVVLS